MTADQVCTQCGAPITTKFCTECGHPAPPAPGPPAPATSDPALSDPATLDDSPLPESKPGPPAQWWNDTDLTSTQPLSRPAQRPSTPEDPPFPAAPGTASGAGPGAGTGAVPDHAWSATSATFTDDTYPAAPPRRAPGSAGSAVPDGTYPVDPTHKPPTAPTRTRSRGGGVRILVRAIAAFVVVVGLGAAAVWGYFYYQDRPTNQALATSAEAVEDVLDPLGQAQTLEEVAVAADKSAPALATVEDTLADLETERDPYPRAAADVLRAQRDLLAAIAPLADLDPETPLAWGATQPAIDTARLDLARARNTLERAEPGSADRAPDPAADLTAAAETVGRTSQQALTTDLEDLLSQLSTVTDTAAASTVGAQASPLAEASQSVRSGQEGRLASQLDALTEAFAAIAALDGLTPTTLDAWQARDQDLLEAAQSLQLDATDPVSSMNTWVDRARAKVAAWEKRVAAIRSQRASSIADLDGYSTQVKALMKRYNRARQSTSDALEGAGDFDSYTVQYALDDGLRERRRIAASLDKQLPPTSMSTVHAALVDVVEDAADAVATGEQAVDEYNFCYIDCPRSFRDTSGWQTFSASSAELTTRFAAAESSWNAALRAALDAAGAEKLPPVPDV